MQKNFIIILLFSILIAVFAILNAGAITLNLIFGKVDVSTALVILISASIGAIIVYSIDAISKMRLKKHIKELEKKMEVLLLENKKHQLKSDELVTKADSNTSVKNISIEDK